MVVGEADRPRKLGNWENKKIEGQRYKLRTRAEVVLI